jgi:plastocyanin
MLRKRVAFLVALLGLLLGSGCAGSDSAGSSKSSMVMLPQFDRDLVIWAIEPRDTIGTELSGEGLGTIDSPKWQADLSGYTQKKYSQALAFKPGTKLTIMNLSHNFTHTLNVVEEISGPPADFPKNPKLSIPAKGDGKLEEGYASGPIKPRKTVTVTLVKAGIYLIGCAFHYRDGMRDVLVVSEHGRPGKQATPPPKS